jgi:hypothetical protein
LSYSIDKLSESPNDNIFTFEDPRISYINIKTFLTHLRYENDEYFNYDLREPKRKIIHPDKVLQRTNKLVTSTDDWSNIPYYPTTKERREQTAEFLIKSGKQVPVSLLEQIKKDKEDTIRQDVYNKTNNMDGMDGMDGMDDMDNMTNYGIGNDNISNIPVNNHHYIQRNLHHQNYQTNNYNQYQHQISNRPPNPPHLYSQEYANYVGARNRASASARIRLGGVY